MTFRCSRPVVCFVGAVSASTAALDRGDKFAQYRQMDTVREVMRVDVDARRCGSYCTGPGDLWVPHPAERGQAVVLDSVGFGLSAERVFADV
jgi:Uma2 family endonuclease